MGGGAGGVELALAVRHRMDAEARAAGLLAGRCAVVACAPYPAAGSARCSVLECQHCCCVTGLVCARFRAMMCSGMGHFMALACVPGSHPFVTCHGLLIAQSLLCQPASHKAYRQVQSMTLNSCWDRRLYCKGRILTSHVPSARRKFLRLLQACEGLPCARIHSGTLRPIAVSHQLGDKHTNVWRRKYNTAFVVSLHRGSCRADAGEAGDVTCCCGHVQIRKSTQPSSGR